MKSAAVSPELHGQAAAAEDREHGGIFGKHLGVEMLYVSLPGDANEMLQDKRGNATATIIAVGHEGDLGPVLALSGVASSTNQNFAVRPLRRDHESNDLAEIDIGQLIELAAAQLFLGAEEAPVDRLPVERSSNASNRRPLSSWRMARMVTAVPSFRTSLAV